MKYAATLLLVAVLALPSCRTAGPAAQAPAGKRDVAERLTEEERMNLQYIFFNANKEKILGNADKALELFAQCIRIDNQNDASMYELASIYAEKKKYNDALFFALSAAELDPSNNWYQLLVAELYRETGRYKESVEVYERLVHDNPDRLDYYFDWANALLYAGRPEKAIDVFDMIEERTGVSKELTIQKERLYLKLGKTDKAAAELEKLIADAPGELDGYSLLVDLYQANGMQDKALETIERMKRVNAESPQVYLALAEYYRSAGEPEKSFEQLKFAFASPRLDSDVKLRIVGSYYPLVHDDEKMMGQALTLCRILVDTHPREAMAHTAYGEFLTAAERYDEANAQYAAALALDKTNENVWQQYLGNAEMLRAWDSLATVSAGAMELFPNNPVYYLFNGIGLAGQERYPEAVKVLQTGVRLVVDNDPLLSTFYSKLGDCYHELADHPASDENYDKALELNPHDAYTLNNYAYYLSLRRENLDKAAGMSQRSNDLMPHQASFEDTYGWILYQQGKYDDARTWLEKAMQDGGDGNGTILEHYGDVLYKLNDVTRAVEYWLKARDAGDGSMLLDRKIAEKKLVE